MIQKVIKGVDDEIEFKAFTSPNDDRPKTWLIMNRKEAERLTGFGI